jgi:hypothetical protein
MNFDSKRADYRLICLTLLSMVRKSQDETKLVPTGRLERGECRMKPKDSPRRVCAVRINMPRFAVPLSGQ